LKLGDNENEGERDDEGVPERFVGDSSTECVSIDEFDVDNDLVNVKHCTPAHENSSKILTRVYGAYATGLISMPRRPLNDVQASCRT
jgi:hypothetical protein